MAKTKLREVDLEKAQAKKIVKAAIEFGARDGEVPKSQKELLEAANEVLSFCIDAWVTDGVRPDDSDEEIAASGKEIIKILGMAGIKIDDDNNITYPDDDPDDDDDDDDSDDDSDDDDDDDDDGEEEGPFDPDDYIDGYTELAVKSKINKLKKLDPDDEEDSAILVAIYEWEDEQDKPSSRVMDFITETGVIEDDDDDNDDDEDDDDDEQDENGADEEPWDGYDESTATDIKKVLTDSMEDDELTPEQVQYVLDYEQNRERPPPRKRIIKLCEELLEQLESEDDDDDDDEDEKPAKKSSARSRKRGKSSDPDDDDDADDAVARDDERESRKRSKRKSKAGDGEFTVSDGEGEFTVYGKNAAAGLVIDLIESGSTSITVEVG